MSTPRYRTDHIHYRTLNAAAAAQFWTDIFGASETARVVANGRLRVVLDLDGAGDLRRGGAGRAPARRRRRPIWGWNTWRWWWMTWMLRWPT